MFASSNKGLQDMYAHKKTKDVIDVINKGLNRL